MKMARKTGGVGLGLLLLVVGLVLWRPVQAEAVCAQVKIEIKQELTLERQAFDAMMRINNGLDTLPIENVDITVSFADEDGNSVLASSDPNNTEAKFFIRLDTMDNIADVSGAGAVAPNTTAEIHWLIIPAPGAAEDLPGGKLFFVGARLSYTLGGVEESVEVTPDFITVKPLPRLTLDYFLTRDVIGDDTFTPETEPSEPYTLGVRVKNDGIAAANNLKIESAQPTIIEDENELGLAIGFEIIGSSVDDAPAAPTLLIDFGAIAGNSARVGRWQMISSLSGEFVDFTATFTHADELGGQLTSLIEGIHTHKLIHDVRVDLPGRDRVRDFLAKDGDVYRVYESEGLDTAVIDASAQAGLSVLDAQTGYTDYRLTLPANIGFSYVQLPDPKAGGYQVISATRSDGKVLSLDNVWTSRTRNRDNPGSWFYHLNLFDVDSTGSYTVRLGPTVVGPEPPVIAFMPDRTTSVNVAMGFVVESSDPNGDPIVLSTSPLPAGAVFIDNGDGTGFLNWTPVTGQAGSYVVRVTASDGGLESSRWMTITVNGDGDSDGDGMDDDWEMLWFETLARDGSGDYDGDGISDLREFQNATDPARAPGPGQPEPLSPGYAQAVDHLEPALRVQNGRHALTQTVSYYFEVYRDAALYELVAASGPIIEAPSGETEWVVNATLDDNTTYYWRVRAHDGTTYSEWARGRFFVNTVNDPPSAPQPDWPADGGYVAAPTPTLSVRNSTDADGDELLYGFEVFADAALTIPVEAADGIPAGDGVTQFRLATDLTDGVTYYWVATVIDEQGVSAQGPVAQFTLNSASAVPSAPVLIAPGLGGELASTEVDLVAAIVAGATQYRFELDTVNTFDSPDRMISEPASVVVGVDTVVWRPPVLNDNTRYYWRARSSDAFADSQWVVGEFVTNTANDAPPVPLPGNLDVAAWSGTLTPTLYLVPADDVDGDAQRYEFELYAYSRVSGVGVLLASAQTNEPRLDLATLAPLATEYTWLAWRARAVDEHDAASDWMAPVPLYIDNVTVPETLLLDAPADIAVAEGGSATIDLLTFGVSAPVCLQPVGELPAFATFTDLGDGRATLRVDPAYQVAGAHVLTVIAGHRGTLCDNDDRMAPFAPVTHAITVTVGDTNRAPHVPDLVNYRAAEGDAVSLPVGAVDPDGDAMTFSATGLPSGLAIDALSGVISGSLPYDAAGIYNVVIDVIDDGAPPRSAQGSFVFEVSNTNRAPILSVPDVVTATEGLPFELNLQATDPDGDAVSFTAEGLPPGLAVDSGVPALTGVPEAGTAGSYTVLLNARDDGAPPLSDTRTLMLVVVADTQNQPPSVVWLSPLDNAVYAPGATVTFQVAASDPDGSIARVRFYVNGVLLEEVTAEPYAVNWMAGALETYSLMVEATDNEGGVTSVVRKIHAVDVSAHTTVHEAYYVLNPRMSLGDASVVSLEDDNLIQVGNTRLYLDQYQRGVLPAAELVAGAVITGTGPFDVGSEVVATDMPVSSRMAGTQFVVPHVRESHTYYLLSPYGDAQATLQVNGAPSPIDLPQGIVVTYDAGSNNDYSARIRSDLPILVAHTGVASTGVALDAMPVPPAAYELWGLRSKNADVAALEANTEVAIYTSSGEWLRNVILQAGERYTVGIGDSSPQGLGSTVQLIADKPIGAVQSADGDGYEQTAFLPQRLLGTRFGIPVDAEYVVASCAKKSARVVLHRPDGSFAEEVCMGDPGLNPGNVYFSGPVPAGSYIESESALHVTYETQVNDGEHNLLGANPERPSFYVLNTAASQSDARVVSLEDDNRITVGATTLTLDRYQLGVIPGAELTPGSVISGSGAFDIQMVAGGEWDTLVSRQMAGVLFVMPTQGGLSRYHLLSPDYPAEVRVQTDNAMPETLTLLPGQVAVFDVPPGSDVTAFRANTPILVAGVQIDSSRYAFAPIPPASTELWGVIGDYAIAWAGALVDGTALTSYAGDGSVDQRVVDAGRSTQIFASDFASAPASAVHVLASEPIMVSQSDASTFLPAAQLGMRFALPTAVQSVAIACTQDQAMVALYTPDGEDRTAVCQRNGDSPGHIYFAVPGAVLPAGSYIEAAAPIHVTYALSTSPGIHRNARGTIPMLGALGPMDGSNLPPMITSPGDQVVGEGQTVSMAIIASDPDGDSLSFSASGLPDGLSIDGAGLISGSPSFGSAGTYVVEVTVADDGEPSMSAAVIFTFTVVDSGNTAPTALPIDAGSVAESAGIVTIDLLEDASASDADGDFLAVSIVRVIASDNSTVQHDLSGAFVSIDPAQFASSLNAGDQVTITVSYTIDDGRGGVTANTATLVVTGEGTPSAGETIDFSGTGAITSYGINQDQMGSTGYAIEDGGATLRLTGNTWKKLALPSDMTIGAGMKLRFSFEIPPGKAGEIHAIGLDTDADIANTGTLSFQLSASQSFDYSTEKLAYDGGFVTYEIDLSPYAGQRFSYITFINDDDANSGAESLFSNVAILSDPRSNTAPTAFPIDAGSVAESAGIVTIDLLGDANASDADGDSLIVKDVQVVDGNNNAVRHELSGASLTIDPARFVVSLSEGDHATLTVSYLIDDGYGGVASNTATLVVTGEGAPSAWEVVDFRGTGVITPYGSNQDAMGYKGYSTEDGGATLHLIGNTWKRFTLPSEMTVGADTKLRFSFYIPPGKTGEIHTIGLDTDLDHTNAGTLTFLLAGSQSFGYATEELTYDGGFVTYEIDLSPYAGQRFSYITFLNDDDANSRAESFFSNVIIEF